MKKYKITQFDSGQITKRSFEESVNAQRVVFVNKKGRFKQFIPMWIKLTIFGILLNSIFQSYLLYTYIN